MVILSIELKCKTMHHCHCKPESALSVNDNVSVYDIMNVSSVGRERAKQMCRLQWDTEKTRNRQSTRKRGIKKHDLSLHTKQDDSQTAH